MTTPHSAPDRPLLPRSVLHELPLRRLTVADLSACSDLAESRGWAREEHKWRLLLTAGQGYGIDAPDEPGALIGTFVLTSYGAGTSATAPGYTGIGMLLVAERCARQGLGRRMMLHALEESGDAVPFLTATENGRPLYEQLGFTSVGRLTMLTGRLDADGSPEAEAGADAGRARTASVSAPVPTPTRIRLATAADMASVRALDARAFGADRTELLARLPAFADRFIVSEAADGTLTGFAASWPNTHNTVIGPVVTGDVHTAEALIADLGSHAPGEIRFDSDSRHGDLERWLRAHGLSGEFACTVMVRGASALPGDPDKRFAPYSVALG